MRSLYQYLLDIELVRLRAIARFWDIELATNRQREAAAQLAEALAEPQTIASALDALPADQRQALEALFTAGGHMPLRIFARTWGEIRAMGPGRMEREQPWLKPISPAEGLWYSGFIVRTFEQEDDSTYEAVLIPPELQAHLPVPPAAPPTIALSPASEPATVHVAGDAPLDDACTLLAYLQNERVRPNPDGSWPAHHEARLARQLWDPDPDRLALLRHLAHRLGWLRLTDSGHLRPDPDTAAAWLQSSTNQQRYTLVQAWRHDPTWNDLFHVTTLQPEDTGAWRNDPLLAREAIIRHLQVCTPQNWYTIEDLVAAVKQADPDFQRPDGDYTNWYIRDAVTGAYLSGFESWDAVEGALIRYLIVGPLASLGLADLGAAGPGLASATPSSASTMRLTQAGAAFLGLAAPPPDPAPAPLTLRPDFTVLAPPAGRYERFQLARVADWVCTAAPFVYRLTPTSLERARRQGISVARVIQFLERATGAPVPHSAETALARWEARGPEVRLERAVLLRLSSEELMRQLTSSPLTRHLIQEQVGPTAALVRQRDWARLITALSEVGLLLDVSNLEEEGGC